LLRYLYFLLLTRNSLSLGIRSCIPLHDENIRKEKISRGNFQYWTRFVYRSPHQDEIDQIRKRQETLTFKKRSIERKWKTEDLFGEAKHNRCLRRAKYRGIGKMQIQFFVIALARNEL